MKTKTPMLLVIIILLIFSFLYLINARCGNPITKNVVESKSTEILSENYSNETFYIENIDYDHKNFQYTATINLNEDKIKMYYNIYGQYLKTETE